MSIDGNGPTPPEFLQAMENSELLSQEQLGKFQNLEIGVEADLGPVLERLNQRLGMHMESRESGFHLTVVGPTESKVLKTLTPEQLDALNQFQKELTEAQQAHDSEKLSQLIQIDGIGVIDGSSEEWKSKLREVDQVKKTSFIAFSSPRLNEIRVSLGLPPKDFHITLGFEHLADDKGGDIHMQITGTNEKGKPVLGPIPKKADPSYDDVLTSMDQPVDIKIGKLTGPEKEAPTSK